MKMGVARPAVRGSTTGRPVMVLLDLLGRRMALRVLWELYTTSEAMTFRALAEAADTNPSVLNARLKELREARLVGHGDSGYGLTDEGRALVALILPLHSWADAWATGARPKPAARAKAKLPPKA
jgi:DNA-binding HxlR family transcriptional regulator